SRASRARPSRARARDRAGAGARAGARRGGGEALHVPDAPRDRAGGAGQLPEVRHGPRAEGAAPAPRRRHRGAAPQAAGGMGARAVTARDGAMEPGARAWIELALATPVATWAAWPFYERAIASVRHRSPNMFTLIGLGVSVAYGYSVVATLRGRGYVY